MALVSFDLDGVLQRNPFRAREPIGVFAHIKREISSCLDDSRGELDPLKMIMDEHRRRVFSGLLVEAHDWDDIAAGVARDLGCKVRINVADLVTQYCQKPGLVYLYPSAREVLQVLREAGHTLVATTNGFRTYQEPVLRTNGILHLFAAVLTPDEVGAAKPQREIFLAAESFDSPRIHIGDTLHHDVAGAKRSGWDSIYVVQMGAPGATEMPPELIALPPWERPAAGKDWLLFRMERDRRWHGYPPATLEECTPSAIVHHLEEVPDTVAAMLSARPAS